MTRKSSRGFTLVELLVVIGIIAVLISILLPTINKARRSAKTTAGLSNLKQIGTGLRLYATTNKDSLPYGYTLIFNAAGTGIVDIAGWHEVINKEFNPRAGGTYLTTPISAYSKVFKDPNAVLDAESVTYSAHPRALPDMQRMLVYSGNDSSSANFKAMLKTIKPYRFAQLKPDDALIMDGCQQTGGGWNNDSYYTLYRMDAFLGDLGYAYFGTGDPYADAGWYETGSYTGDIDFGPEFTIDPNVNRDEYLQPSSVPGRAGAQGSPRWRQRTADTTLVNVSTPQAPYGYAKGASNVLFGDGHCETVASKDFKRKLLLLKKQ